MVRPLKVTALFGHKIQVDYADGVTGIIDLSDVVGQGVFAPLVDDVFFQRVHIGDHGQIAWTNDLEICPDAAYLEIIGQLPSESVHA